MSFLLASLPRPPPLGTSATAVVTTRPFFASITVRRCGRRRCASCSFFHLCGSWRLTIFSSGPTTASGRGDGRRLYAPLFCRRDYPGRGNRVSKGMEKSRSALVEHPGSGGDPSTRSAAHLQSTPSSVHRHSNVAALQRRITELEERVILVGELETRLGFLERDFMLAQSSMSGLASLQQLLQANKTAQGSALQLCLRSMLKKRVGTRPEVLSAKRKRRSPVLTMEHTVTRGAVDQLLALASVDAVCTRGVGGRVSGRLVRFKETRGLLSALGCSSDEATAFMCKSFTRLNGSVSTRLLMERFLDIEGDVSYILRRNQLEGTVDVAQRGQVNGGSSQLSTRGRLELSSIQLDSLPGLCADGPSSFRWVATGDPAQRAGLGDEDVVGKMVVTLPTCVVEDSARDLQALLEM